jgi:hypothetical protein
MRGSLADGFEALQALAREATPARPESSLRQKLHDDLTYEAQKFLIYRLWKMKDREWLSLNRLRSLTTMLNRAA